MTNPAVYDPQQAELPTTAEELLEFVSGMPDEAHRALGIAIARTLMGSDAAMLAARNARQMVLNRDPRFDTLEERVGALATLTDQLNTLAADYQTALSASTADRAKLNTSVTQLRTDLAALGARVDTAVTNLTNEVTRATTAETQLRTDLAAEVVRAKKAEADEVTARAAAVADVQRQVSKTAADLTAEVSARTAGDTALGARIDATNSVFSALQTAVTALAARVTTIETNDEPPFIAGQVYGTSGGAFVYQLTHGELQTTRIKIPSGSAPIKGMAFEVTSQAQAGRFVRLGLWADNGSGFPGQLLASGIVYPLSVGGKVLTFSTPVSYIGQVHMGIRPEVATGYSTAVNNPQIRGVTAYLEGVPTLMSGTAAASLVSAATGTGSFGNAPAMVPDIGGGPRITLVF